MRLLLLGGSGQLGSDFLAAAGRRSSFPITRLDRAALDLTDLDAIGPALAARPFDALLNLTSFHRTDDAESRATEAFDLNARAVRALARGCAAKGARFWHVSTDYVFGGDAARRTPYREDDPMAPVNVYGASKALGETLARLEHEDTVILRTASLFGRAGSAAKGGNFVESMLRLGKAGRPLRVVDDQVMSPTAASDAADMLLGLIEAKVPPGIYHLVNSGSASWYDFAREIFHQAGLAPELDSVSSAEYAAPARRPAYSVLDTAKIAGIRGSPVPWQDALARYLRAREA